MDLCKKSEMIENAFQSMYSIIAVKQQKRRKNRMTILGYCFSFKSLWVSHHWGMRTHGFVCNFFSTNI